jgi:uncharacterized protein YjeT (DUF2065 family)
VSDFLCAVGLVFVLERVVSALFPERMKRTMLLLSAQPSGLVRSIGLGAAVFGLAVVWLVRG